MQRKIFLVLLVLLIAFPLVVPYGSVQQANANGFVRIVAGSSAAKLAKAIGEKAGLKMASKKQEDNMIGYINKQAETNPAYTKFVNDLNTAAAQTKETDRPGWKKYLLDPALWISGADILVTGYQAYKNAYEQQTALDTVSVLTGGTNSGLMGCAWSGNDWWVYFKPDGDYKRSISGLGGGMCTLTYQSSLPAGSTDGYITVNWEIKREHGTSSDNTYNTKVYVRFPWSWEGSGFAVPQQITPDMYDVPEQYEVIDLNDYDFGDDDTVQVYVPEDDTPESNDYSEPWNDVLEPPTPTDPTDPTDPPAPEPPDEEKPSGWKWWDWLLKPLIKLIEGIGDLLSGIGDAIKTIVDFILGLAEWLLGLIVPSGEFFSNFFDDIHAAFESKIPIIPQLMNFFTSIENASVSGEAPKFTFTLPDEYGGTTHSLIDFNAFEDYRAYILNFIRFIAWFIFLKRLFNRIPKIIY